MFLKNGCKNTPLFLYIKINFENKMPENMNAKGAGFWMQGAGLVIG